MEKDIFLIRHSEQLKVEDTIKYDVSDQLNNEKIILSVNGEKLAKEISELEELQNIETLWSSNYVRALATAKYIAENNNIEINVDNRLNERKLGDINKIKELVKNKENSFTVQQLKDKDLKNINGESNKEVSKRMQSFLHEIINNYDYKKIAIVSHGASIKFLLSNYCKLDNNMNLVYNNKILNIKSPSVIQLKVSNNNVYSIKQIY